MHRSLTLFGLFVIGSVIFPGCNRGTSEFKQIQQQRSGDYTVSLLNETGVLKQSSDHLRIEIRNASTNELAGVNNVKVQATMMMAGMGPMFGTFSAPQQVAPGQYELDASMGMTGQWNLVVTFDPNGRAQFSLRAQ
jgi:hypothetical protein